MRTMRLSRSIVGQEEAAAASKVLLEDGYLGMGAEVKAFEEEVAAFLLRAPAEVASMSSGTAAIHLAVEAALQPGDEVLVQSLTFVATFQGICAAGAVPVPCEVTPESATIDLLDAERRLTDRCKAIMPVHYASYPGDLDAVYEFARKHHLRVIEDAAHAFGCRYKGRMIGGFGDVACFSFDGIKNITCGEGGAVVSSDQTIMSQVRTSRLLGVENDTAKRFASQRSWDFDVLRRGYRYHMSNIFAAIGRVQLRRFPGEFAANRVALARRYRERLSGVPGVSLLATDLGAVVPHIQPVLVSDNKRDGVRAALEAEGIQTGIHYKPNHLLTLYGGGKESLPTTERIYSQILSLPLHPGLESADVDRVCQVLERSLRGT